MRALPLLLLATACVRPPPPSPPPPPPQPRCSTGVVPGLYLVTLYYADRAIEKPCVNVNADAIVNLTMQIDGRGIPEL